MLANINEEAFHRLMEADPASAAQSQMAIPVMAPEDADVVHEISGTLASRREAKKMQEKVQANMTKIKAIAALRKATEQGAEATHADGATSAPTTPTPDMSTRKPVLKRANTASPNAVGAATLKRGA